ncbi:MAG: RNase adapter RapZ [Rhodospirillales bacterium]|nr:RNase adapter RapZ [Rhodospirillales bacterium]
MSAETTAAAIPSPRMVIVTGLSGAGRTSALKELEDLGYEAVDNLPLSLLPSLVRPGETQARPLAVGIDIRTRDFGAGPVLAEIDRLLAEAHLDLTLLFIDCEDEVLARRYTETRRRHPLAQDRPLLDGIGHERQLMRSLRDRADTVIDTSRLAPGDFKRLIDGQFALSRQSRLVVFVTSFAYRHGLPREADLVFDARFLANPHYVFDLRPQSGRDRPVADFIAADPGFAPFFQGLTDLLAPLLPRFAQEGKSYLTIAVGCTGGKHRSVFVAERLARWLTEIGQPVELRHRDLVPA